MEFNHPAYPVDYQPTEPYVTKNGDVLELKMFSDYQNLRWQYQQTIKESSLSGYQQHLIWLLQRGEDRESKMICPHCRHKKVKYFTYSRIEGIIGATSLKEIYCVDCVQGRANQLPFQFSSLRHFHIFGEANFLKNVVPLFLYVFSLPERKTKKVAFNFFKDQENKEKIIKPSETHLVSPAYKPRPLTLF